MPRYILFAKEPAQVYKNPDLTRPIWGALRGGVTLKQVIGVRNESYRTFGDPLGVVIEVPQGWVRLARLCPGEDYEELVEMFPKVKWPTRQKWPEVAYRNLCE